MKCKFCKKKAAHKLEYKQRKLPFTISNQFTDEYEDVSVYVCESCFQKIMENRRIK